MATYHLRRKEKLEDDAYSASPEENYTRNGRVCPYVLFNVEDSRRTLEEVVDGYSISITRAGVDPSYPQNGWGHAYIWDLHACDAYTRRHSFVRITPSEDGRVICRVHETEIPLDRCRAFEKYLETLFWLAGDFMPRTYVWYIFYGSV